jgi:hypothetical protein
MSFPANSEMSFLASFQGSFQRKFRLPIVALSDRGRWGQRRLQGEAFFSVGVTGTVGSGVQGFTGSDTRRVPSSVSG